MATPGLAPRAAAWRVLHALRRGVPLDRALTRALGGLAEADRSLAHEIAAGVLRRQAVLDRALTPYLERGTTGVRDDLLDILRLGAYQLLFLERVPTHAAVDTSVTLARRFGGARVGGFVNAVLRKVAERGMGSGEPLPTPDSLAAAFSHPTWLVERWMARFGREETEQLLSANNQRPALVIQPARWTAAAVTAALDAVGVAWQTAPFSAGIALRGVRPPELPGFTSGAWYVQDPAQALVIRYAAIPPNATVFDACAAPGGKALALSASARFIAAADRNPGRVRRMRNNLERASQGPVAVFAADAAAPPVRPCDVVLLDVPCLGTGVFARHPDARWRVTPEGLEMLAAQAARFLHVVADVVAPGGLLVFSTCSLEPEENELQVEAFLAADPRFRREPPLPNPVPAELLTAAGDLVLLPHRHGTDGGYAARLRRTS
ncbi:MAG: transcription antitermination factor NusB [Gemmatimonadales bacterium]